MSLFAERLTVLDNPRADRVRRVSGLVGRSARSRSGLMLVEGPQAVRELVTHRGACVRDVYVRQDAWETHADVVDAARRVTRWVHPVTAEVSAALSGDSQGICAVASLDSLERQSRANFIICLVFRIVIAPCSAVRNRGKIRSVPGI